jgi:hypothetical protein
MERGFAKLAQDFIKKGRIDFADYIITKKSPHKPEPEEEAQLDLESFDAVSASKKYQKMMKG